MSSLIFNLLRHPDFCQGREWRPRAVAANEVVFAEGERGNEIFLILSGQVRVIGNVDLDNDKQLHPGFSDLGPGEIFGELAVLDGEPRSASVNAIMNTELAVIDGLRFLAFLDHHPDIAYPISKELNGILVKRLRAANRRIFSLFAWGLKARGIDRHL